VTLEERASVIVDPNSSLQRDPSLTVARFADADRVPAVGETVIASQPDDDGSDFAGVATVESINDEHELIYLRVDWTSFRDAVTAPAVRLAASASRSSGVHFAVSCMRTTRRLRRGERNGGQSRGLATVA